MTRVLVIAGTGSGVGKTTVTLGLMQAWRRRGLTVQAFKVGPDFIDPGFPELVTGRPFYNLDAECGGLMYLAESLQDVEGTARAMVGLLPAAVSMAPRQLTLGYTEVRFTSDTPLGAAGTVARGHEFHCSTLAPVPGSVRRVYQLSGRGDAQRVEGYLVDNALLSSVHLHFGSNPRLAPSFVEACARARRPRPC